MEVLVHCKNSLQIVGLYDGFAEFLGKISVFMQYASLLDNYKYCGRNDFCCLNANDLLVLLSASYVMTGHLSVTLIYINLLMNDSSLVSTLDHLQKVVQTR